MNKSQIMNTAIAVTAITGLGLYAFSRLKKLRKSIDEHVDQLEKSTAFKAAQESANEQTPPAPSDTPATAPVDEPQAATQPEVSPQPETETPESEEDKPAQDTDTKA